MMGRDRMRGVAKAFKGALYAIVVLVLVACSFVPARREENVKNTGGLYDATLTAGQARDLYVGDVDWERARALGLCEGDDFEERYLQAAATYMGLLNAWLCDECALDSYQVILEGGDLEFPVDDDEVSALKAHGGFGRSNVFIRSTAYVERLSKEDLALVLGIADGTTSAEDEDARDMLIRTWRDVMEVRRSDIHEDFDVVYTDAGLSAEIAPHDALVFVIAYAPSFDENGMLVDEAAEDEKQERAETLRDLMASELSSHMGSVAVFVEG